MRRCVKCSRDIASSEELNCAEPDCPLKAALRPGSGDATMAEVDFDRDEILRMAGRAPAGAEDTDATRLDESHKLEDLFDDDERPAFLNDLIQTREAASLKDRLNRPTAEKVLPEPTLLAEMDPDTADLINELRQKSGLAPPKTSSDELDRSHAKTSPTRRFRIDG